MTNHWMGNEDIKIERQDWEEQKHDFTNNRQEFFYLQGK